MAASPAEENSSALACSSSGQMLLVYAKGSPDGKVQIAARTMQTP